MMKTWKYTLNIILFLFAFNSIPYCQPAIEEVVPANWPITKYISVPKNKLPYFSQRLGGKIVSIENYILTVSEIPLQINRVECSSDNDAQNIYNTFITLQKTDENYLLANHTVYEFICKNPLIMKKQNPYFTQVLMLLFGTRSSISRCYQFR